MGKIYRQDYSIPFYEADVTSRVKLSHHVTKIFFLCKSLGGQFVANSETLASGYFALDDLPALSVNKTTKEQIALCYEAYKAEHWEARFD